MSRRISFIQRAVPRIQVDPPEVQKGIVYFSDAIAIDRELRSCLHGPLGRISLAGARQRNVASRVFAKSKAAAQKAVELDDGLSDGHTALAATVFWGEWDWKEAENQFKRALELDPNNGSAHLFYSHLLSNLGRHSEALAEIKLARQLDPLFPFGGSTRRTISGLRRPHRRSIGEIAKNIRA